jgi:hypothetical protein
MGTRIYAKCERCGVSEEHEMLAGHNGMQVCNECDSALNREWADADEDNTHCLDAFSPYGD